LLQFKKYHPSGNLKFNYLGILQSLKVRIPIEKILGISLKLNVTPNTLGCYGLILNRNVLRDYMNKDGTQEEENKMRIERGNENCTNFSNVTFFLLFYGSTLMSG